MAQAALITGDQGSGLETHLYIRVSWGVIFENPEGLAAPQTCEVSPSGVGPKGQHLSGSSQALQDPSQGACREGGILAAQLPWSLCSADLGCRWVLWILAHFPRVFMGSGSSLLSTNPVCLQFTEPLPRKTLNPTFRLSNPPLLLGSTLLVFPVRWKKTKQKGVSLKGVSLFIPILTLTHSVTLGRSYMCGKGALAKAPLSVASCTISWTVFLRKLNWDSVT